MKWRAADIRRAHNALDGYALQARDLVTRGDWRVFWREHVTPRIGTLIREHYEIEIARCQEWHASGQELLHQAHAEHATAIERGRPVPISNALDRVRYFERSQQKYIARIRAAERMQQLLTDGMPTEVTNYWPLGVDPP